ncbi:MAG TPA: diacylglycerol kinase family protein [Phenylobacterium sp.]|uniref:diacylglycerol/lipid kinase family protein n=1 Tax=Phenylobacterium sp. TaxID=1871053 RepID=UPI002C4074FF|nr:diacylglycerol kinase family protein [Phenylobacterium sp.]HSV01585.1 diacylglycerol kinase family protein [Phenylobacterium sp.]
MSRIRRVEVVANLASGGVTADTPAEIEKICLDHGLTPHVCAPASHDLTNCLRAAVDAGPDLLILLAGDGTARAAAELCGPAGPVIAPLPGGTMNVLPRALYGDRSWPDALSVALAQGEVRTLAGGEVEGRCFLVAALLGAPAWWGAAREAVREHALTLAWLRARRAVKRAFSGRLRYALDEGRRARAEALVFLCPHVSRALPDEAKALEAAALDLNGAADAFRLGFHALVGDWRDAPAVETAPCGRGRVWAAGRIPALLDGELVRLNSQAEVAYRPAVARVLAPPKDL